MEYFGDPWQTKIDCYGVPGHQKGSETLLYNNGVQKGKANHCFSSDEAAAVNVTWF